MNIAADARSRVTIREITKSLRKMIEYQKNPYFPIVEFIEWVLGDPDNGFSYEIVEAHEMKDMYGNTNTGTNAMRIREDVYNRAVNGNPRDRFTLCHELGHYLLHKPSNVSFARGEIPKYCDPEWQANVFAAELMAPCDLIGSMSVEEIADKCGMSKQAASIQYKFSH